MWRVTRETRPFLTVVHRLHGIAQVRESRARGVAVFPCLYAYPFARLTG